MCFLRDYIIILVVYLIFVRLEFYFYVKYILISSGNVQEISIQAIYIKANEMYIEEETHND
jgi:hypothetical protein